MFTKMFLFVFAIVCVCLSSVFENYDSYSLDDSVSEMSPAYTGPLIATGGAIVDINRFIREMEPTKIGLVESNKIILIDEPNEVYQFNLIKYYKVSKDTNTFYIMKIDAQKNDEKYEIVIELKDGINYDRTLTVYKNGKPYTLILWVETTRVIQKRNNKI